MENVHARLHAVGALQAELLGSGAVVRIRLDIGTVRGSSRLYVQHLIVLKVHERIRASINANEHPHLASGAFVVRALAHIGSGNRHVLAGIGRLKTVYVLFPRNMAYLPLLGSGAVGGV